MGACDFCGEPVPSGSEKVYAAEDIVVRTIMPPDTEKPLHIMSNGDWGACAACAELVDIDARDRLLKRMFDVRVGAFDNAVPPEKREQVRGQQRDTLRRSLAAFYKARK